MRATYFQLHQAHNALRIWGTLGQDCQILKYCLICLHMKFCTFCGMGTGRLQLPFAVPFCGMTSYGLMGWNRALQKNKFSGSDFFAHAWTASNPLKIDMWIELGVFSAMWLWKADERKPRRPHIGHIGRPQRLRKTSPLRNSSSQSSGVKTDALTIVPQDPCLRGPSYSLSELAAKGWGLVWRPCQRLPRHSGSSSLASNASRRLRRRLLRHSGRFPRSFLVASESNVRQ